MTDAERETESVHEAETAIVKILARLEDETGKSIDHVDVDTRNWGRLATTITLTTRVRQ